MVLSWLMDPVCSASGEDAGSSGTATPLSQQDQGDDGPGDNEPRHYQHPDGCAEEERGRGEHHRRDHPGHHDRGQRRAAAPARGHQAQQGNESERAGPPG